MPPDISLGWCLLFLDSWATVPVVDRPGPEVRHPREAGRPVGCASWGPLWKFWAGLACPQTRSRGASPPLPCTIVLHNYYLNLIAISPLRIAMITILCRQYSVQMKKDRKKHSPYTKRLLFLGCVQQTVKEYHIGHLSLVPCFLDLRQYCNVLEASVDRCLAVHWSWVVLVVVSAIKSSKMLYFFLGVGWREDGHYREIISRVIT